MNWARWVVVAHTLSKIHRIVGAWELRIGCATTSHFLTGAWSVACTTHERLLGVRNRLRLERLQMQQGTKYHGTRRRARRRCSNDAFCLCFCELGGWLCTVHLKGTTISSTTRPPNPTQRLSLTVVVWETTDNVASPRYRLSWDRHVPRSIAAQKDNNNAGQ